MVVLSVPARAVTPRAAAAPTEVSVVVNSGVLPLGETSQVQHFSMSFAKTGTSAYYCVLHPNMVGTVEVATDTQDSQKKITKTGNQQKAECLKESEAAKAKLLKAKPKSTKNSEGTTTYTVQTEPRRRTPTCSRSRPRRALSRREPR
jgi:hypothetical protein